MAVAVAGGLPGGATCCYELRCRHQASPLPLPAVQLDPVGPAAHQPAHRTPGAAPLPRLFVPLAPTLRCLPGSVLPSAPHPSRPSEPAVHECALPVPTQPMCVAAAAASATVPPAAPLPLPHLHCRLPLPCPQSPLASTLPHPPTWIDSGRAPSASAGLIGRQRLHTQRPTLRHPTPSAWPRRTG